jgi:hypothetical protein
LKWFGHVKIASATGSIDWMVLLWTGSSFLGAV